MKPNELDALIEDCLEGRLSEPDAARLSALLEQSAEARARYWETASIHGLLEHTMQNASLRVVTGQALPTTPRISRWLAWRPLAAAAAGIVFGMFCASLAWAVASPRAMATASLFRSLADASFENLSGRVPSGFPGKVGEWSGDEAAAGSFGALKAKDGQRMLQFLKAEGDAAAPGSTGAFCDVFQVVDLKSLRTELDKSGDTVLELSTAFLDARPSSSAPVQFFCSIYLFEGDAATLRSQWPSALSYAIGRGTGSFITEGGTGDAHWQKATARCLWTAQADFAVIHIAAGRPPNSSGPPVQFGRLFADE